MPEIEIRPATSADLPELMQFDHSVLTHYVWQMERNLEEGQVQINLREIRLPRKIKLNYPYPADKIFDDWGNNQDIIVAQLQGELVGYVRMVKGRVPGAAWIRDVVVRPDVRRQGVGSVLIIAANEWASMHNVKRTIMEFQSKNHPAVKLATRLGYEFCGYNDHYYANQDIAFFYSRYVR
ncbi:MAG: GNAT family N-acetyltransferase [Anaerolineaceae bacterium]|nr:GNAT family N-acetyltransferase [Anaerolineaceae bacterium]